MSIKLNIKNGLLCTSIKLAHEGKSVVVEDIIIDTGAFHTIISSDFLDKLEAEFTDEDILVEAHGYGGASSYSVRKRIDNITCGGIAINDFKADFGEIDPDDTINGLLGLDFFRRAGIVLDLADLVMYKKNN